MCYNGCRFFQPHSERCTLPKGHECPEDIDEYDYEREREEDEWAYERAMEMRYAKYDD